MLVPGIKARVLSQPSRSWLTRHGDASTLVGRSSRVKPFAILPLAFSVGSNITMSNGFSPPVTWKAGEPFDFTLVFEFSIFSILSAAIFVFVAIQRIIALLANDPAVGGRYFQCTKLVRLSANISFQNYADSSSREYLSQMLPCKLRSSLFGVPRTRMMRDWELRLLQLGSYSLFCVFLCPGFNTSDHHAHPRRSYSTSAFLCSATSFTPGHFGCRKSP